MRWATLNHSRHEKLEENGRLANFYQINPWESLNHAVQYVSICMDLNALIEIKLQFKERISKRLIKSSLHPVSKNWEEDALGLLTDPCFHLCMSDLESKSFRYFPFWKKLNIAASGPQN